MRTLSYEGSNIGRLNDSLFNTLLSKTAVSFDGYTAEVGALFTTVSSIRVSRVGRVRVTLTVTVRVSRVSVMVSVRDSVK